MSESKQTEEQKALQVVLGILQVLDSDARRRILEAAGIMFNVRLDVRPDSGESQ